MKGNRTMKTYDDLLKSLERAGFKDIRGNYSCRSYTPLHVGYGHNNDPHPPYQLRVFRTQEGGFQSPFYFQDWMEFTGCQTRERVRNLEQIFAAAVALVPKALKLEEKYDI